MKAKTLSRHLREGVKNLSRNGWMTFASVSAVTVTLLLVGVFLTAIMNMNHFATKVDFPAPLGPTTYTNSPCLMLTVRPAMAFIPFGYSL